MQMYVPECGRPLLQKKFPGGFKSIAAIAAGVENARCRHARKGAQRRDDAKCCLNEALKNSMLYFRTKKHSMKAVLAVIHKNPGLAAVCGRGERDGRDGQRKRGVVRACKVNLRTPALFCIAGYRDCPGIRKRLQGEQTARPKAFRSCISYGFPSTCKADAVLLLSMFLPGQEGLARSNQGKQNQTSQDHSLRGKIARISHLFCFWCAFGFCAPEYGLPELRDRYLVCSDLNSYNA